MSDVSVTELIDVASRHGIHCTVTRVHDAVNKGQLETISTRPMRFTQAEANRWLNAIARHR